MGPVPPPSKESTLDPQKDRPLTGLLTAAPFGDPLTRWTNSKQNLLIFGPSNYDKSKGVYEHEVDTQSVSTVSGSGMDFFRKFVQRKGPKIPTEPTNDQECKECETQFRREVLIDRLVADALNNQGLKKGPSPPGSSTHHSSGSSQESAKYVGPQESHEPTQPTSDLVARALSSCSSGKCRAHQGLFPEDHDLKSIFSSQSESTVSGSGLLFLRNYLKKKTAPPGSNDTTLLASAPDDNLKSEATLVGDSSHQQMVFNTVPIPFPPKNQFYGPAMYIPDELAFCSSDGEEGRSRRNSFGSTIADLLNDNFDSEDSELKNLDWEDWETEEEKPSSLTETDTDDSSIVVDILDMAQPVLPTDHAAPSRIESIISTESEISFLTETTEEEPTLEELQSIKIDVSTGSVRKKNRINIPFLDLPSPPSSRSSGSITPTADDETSLRTLISTPHEGMTTAMSTDSYSSYESSISQMTGTRPKVPTSYQQVQNWEANQGSKKRLAQFWEKRVSSNLEQPAISSASLGQHILTCPSTDSLSKFKPSLPSYYDPEGTRKANDKIQRFLEATKKASYETGVSIWSANYERLQRGELPYSEDHDNT